MKPLRVLVLMHESLVPPEQPQGLQSEQQIDEFRAEYDVKACLEKAGHTVNALGLGDNLGELRTTITEWKPDVAFNLLEEFQGIVTYDQYVVAFLELMKQPYTGCNPRGMMISRDKALTKQILSYHRIPTPGFALIRKGQRHRVPRRLKFPLFVKSVTEDASLGISQASIVTDAERLRAHRVHARADGHRRVGRGVHRGPRALRRGHGQRAAATFPVWEMDFGTLPDVMAGIATRKVKWDRKYQKSTASVPAPRRRCPTARRAYLDRLSKRIYRALYTERLRAHRLPIAARRQHLRARGERESEHQPPGRLRRLGRRPPASTTRRCSSRSSAWAATIRRRGGRTRNRSYCSRLPAYLSGGASQNSHDEPGSGSNGLGPRLPRQRQSFVDPALDVGHDLLLADVVEQVVEVAFVELERLVGSNRPARRRAGCREGLVALSAVPCRINTGSVISGELLLQPLVGADQLGDGLRRLHLVRDQRILVHRLHDRRDRARSPRS